MSGTERLTDKVRAALGLPVRVVWRLAIWTWVVITLPFVDISVEVTGRKDGSVYGTAQIGMYKVTVERPVDA